MMAAQIGAATAARSRRRRAGAGARGQTPLAALRRTCALAALLALAAAALASSRALDPLNRMLYDRLLAHQARPPPQDVVVVAVDEHSLAELGRWPFSRRLHARLIERLSAAGAAAIGFDIILSEPEADAGADAELARAMTASARVVLPVAAEPDRRRERLRETRPLEALERAAAALGHVDVELDGDGIARSTFTRAGLGVPRWPAFGLAVAELAASGRAPAPVLAGDHAPPGVWTRERPLLVPFLGRPGHFRQLAYADVLAGRVPAETFAGHIVLVGVTAAGLAGGLPTPVSAGSVPMSSVEFNANVLQAFREQRLVERAATGAVALASGAVALVALLAMAALRSTRAGAAFTAGGCTLVTLVSLALLAHADLWWPPAAALLAVLGAFVLHILGRLDITRRELADERRQADATLRSVGDAVLSVDAALRVSYLNPAAERMTGWRTGEARGRPLAEVLCASGAEPAIDAVKSCLDGETSPRTDLAFTLTARGGARYEVHASAAPVRIGEAGVTGAVLALRDLTQLLRLERELAHRANHDPLTGLPNRALAYDRLTTALERAERDRRSLAVLCLDLDHFKRTNDGYGHGLGDALLTRIGARMRAACRARDTVARLGGDEFLLILEDIHNENEVTAIAGKLLDAVAGPIEIEGHSLEITASVGVSLFPKDGAGADELLRHASSALGRAKESGRNAVRFFSETMDRESRRRAFIERSLRGALGRGEFEVHYQPVVSLESGRMIGMEALLRWPAAPDGIEPSQFIPVAEESGDILSIGAWVLETACSQIRDWDVEGLPGLRIAVNLSPRQLLERDMPRLVERVLERTGLEPWRLELEITETAMLHDAERSAAVLQELKTLGIRLAIDDFGTGYSSLSHLKRFPVDRLKLDRSFVTDIGTASEGAAISRAVVAMARSLELDVVAEGVETRAQMEFLRGLSCHEGQGFLLCPPMAASELATLVERIDGHFDRYAEPG